jgi:Flp pilus assembly protein CpaB
VLVVVASTKIPYGTKIVEPERVCALREFDADSVSPKALRSFDEINGKHVNKVINSNAILTSQDLMTDEGLPMLRIRLGPSPFSFEVKREAFTSSLVVGDHVDVIGNGRTESGIVSKTVLQDKLVLGIGSSRRDDEKQTMTLQLTPDDCERLTAAITVGVLQLGPATSAIP